MSTPASGDRRLLRRELHRSRSVPAVLVLTVVIAAAAWFAVECALRLLGRDALLARPGAIVDAAVEILTDPGPWWTWLYVAAGVTAVLAVVLGWLAIAPGRRSRHVLDDERLLVVADDTVLAAALARTARTSARLGPDRTQAWVAKRTAKVTLVPTAGVPVEVPEVQASVSGALEGYRVSPTLNVEIRRSEKERVA